MTDRPSKPDGAFVQPLTVPRDVVPGVNLAGFLDGELGLGEVARKLGRALEHAGLPFAAIPYGRTPSRKQHPLELEPSREAPFDTNVICLNADDLYTFVGDVGVEFFSGRYSIGVWFWESSVLRSDCLRGRRFVDEVWVASEYVRRVVAPAVDVPVHVVPLPVEAPSPPSRTRAELGLPEEFLFLYLFDFVSAQRKNPLAVVDAFTRAFAPGEGPQLVLKSINGAERKPRLLGELRAAAEDRSDIRIVDAYFSSADKEAVLAACDCYVSLHRSEGLGLTIAEAMAHGKPVIATGYSGNLEFMGEANSYLVPYRLAAVPEDWWAYAPGAEWADPDVEAAAALMREVYENPSDAAARGELGRETILATFSLDRTAAFVAGRLSDIGGHTGRAGQTREIRSLVLRASYELGRGIGGSLDRRGRAPRLFRRLLKRALWPYLEEQHRLNTSLLDAVSALQWNVDELSRSVARLEEGSASPEAELPGVDERHLSLAAERRRTQP